MLSFWRYRSGIMMHIIFWPIIAVFVIWGFDRYGNPVGGAAAIVNDRTISISEYRDALQRVTDFYQQIMGGNFDERMQKQYHVKQAAMNELIDQELIVEQAQKMGVRVTDAEVREMIVGIPFLQKDGRFSRENYDAFLNYKHLTASQFEGEVRRDILRRKAQHFFEQNVQPSPLEVEKEKALRSVKMNVEFLSIDPGELADKMSVPDAEAAAYLKSPANVKEAQNYFDIHQSDFSKPEEIKARHILIKATKGNEGQEKAAQQKIAEIQKEIKDGADFATLAKKYSEDPGSKDKGGELGWFSREKMVREFSNVAFATPVGTISQPVRTLFGYHLIKVEDKHPAETKTFEQAKETIAKRLIAEKKISDALADAEKKIGTDPQVALKEIQSLDKSVKWDETGFFTEADENIPKIGMNESLADAAFSLSEKKPVYPKLIHENGMVYAVRLKKTELEPVTDVSKIKDQLSKEYSRDLFSSWAGSLRAGAEIQLNNQLFTDED